MSFKDLPPAPLPETPSLDVVETAMQEAVKAPKKAARAATKLAVSGQSPVADVAMVSQAAAADVAGAMEAAVEETAAAVADTRIPSIAPSVEDASTSVKGLFKMATAAPATAQAMFGEMNDRTKGMMEKTARMGEEMVELAKGNVEAMVASARVAAKGSESLVQDAAEYGKKSFESATSAFKSFAAVKSPTELFQLQSDYAKTAFDSAVAEASKFSEAMLKLAGDVAQPLSTRYAVASEKMKATTASTTTF